MFIFIVCGSMIIYHDYNELNWREYNGTRTFTDYPIYPYNKKKLIKGTNLEYAPLDEFQEKFYLYNFIDTLEVAAYDSFELLWKMKLYNLSLYSNKFNIQGSFYKRFKVPKNYLKFMQDNDVTYHQLRVMQLLKDIGPDNIKKYIEKPYGYNNLRFFKKYNAVDEYISAYNKKNRFNMKLFRKVAENVPIRKFLKYKQGLENLYIYSDYLEMADKLALNYKSKDDLFPDNLIERHDELQTKITLRNDIKHCYGIYLNFLKLSKYIYEDDNYIIFPANSSEEFVSEAKQQCNCVNSMYSEKYANGETEIYFMRDINDVTKSLVTLEFKDNKVTQKEQANHENTTEEQDDFIDKWLMYRQFIDKKQKYKQKQIKSAIYELKTLVA